MPYFAAIPAHAEDITPTPIVESTPAPENTPVPEITQAPEPTAVPTEVIVPTVVPTEAPIITPTEVPVITPEITVAPTVTEEPTASPIVTLEPTTAPTITDTPTSTPSNNEQPSNNNSGSSDNNSNPSNSESSPASPTPTFMLPSPTPTPTPRFVEQVCSVAGETIRDSVELDWNYDCATDTYVTREKVKLGVKYIFPKENNVTVTFTSLPKDELYRSYLKIKQVKTSDLKLPGDIGNVGEYAYDITTDMFDGEFKYDITLPKNPDQTAEISYIEKTLDQAKTGVAANEINSVDESKVEQQDNKVVVTNIDHFTIFVVTTSGNSPVLSTASVNNQSQVTVLPNENITVSMTVTRDNNEDWKGSEYKIGNNPWQCVNTTDHNGNGSNTESFVIPSPNTIGNYTLTLRADTKNGCNGTSSAEYPMNNGNTAITVQSLNSITNPSLPQACGLDIALVLDVSGSIDSTELNQMKTAFKGFVDALAGTPTQFSVTKFDTTASVLQTFTGDSALVKTKIDSAFGGNYTNWQDGFVKTNSTLPNRSNPNLVIFASDGNPNRTGISGTSVNETIAVADAVTVANTIKSGGTRILALGIGSDLDIANMKAISGNSADTGNVLTSDVISTNFSTLATQLATFATQTCGGTLTIQKAITGLSSPTLSGWHFTVNGQDYSTDSEGKTSAIPLSAGTYSVTENLTSGYNLSGAVCTGATNNGTFDGTNKRVNGIQISNTNIVSCTFTNAYVPVCGDSVISTGEQCDDGANNANTCNAPYGGNCSYCDAVTCQNKTITGPKCGDHHIDSGETCDDGNITSGDGCSATCQTENGTLKVIKHVVNSGAGNKVASNFSITVTGSSPTPNTFNGVESPGTSVSIGAGAYSVSEGSHTNYDVSYSPDCNGTMTAGGSKTCTVTNTYHPYCGDSHVDAGEQCEGNSSTSCTMPTSNYAGTKSCNPTSCSWNSCTTTQFCGDGIKNGSESCDEGTSINGTYGHCKSDCTGIGPRCGDGIINGPENCDGSNLGGLSTTYFRCNSCSLVLINPKVNICHSHDSQSNPYNLETPDKSADVGGHSGHTGSVWYPGIADHSWGDIIPSFDYLDNGVVKNFIGLNWTTQGQAVYNNGCNFAKGHLIVQKTTLPSGDNTSFTISTTGSGTITGSGSGTIKDNQDKNYEVTPGIYSVNETVPTGWDKTGDTCQNVTVNAGETKYCTITNTKKGSLKIIKDTQPDDTQNFIFNLKDSNNVYVGSTELDDDNVAYSRPNNHTFNNLTPGTYKVYEDPVTGWTLNNITCTNTTGTWEFKDGYLSVNVKPGEQPSCTFINTRDTGTIRVLKNVDLNGDGDYTDSDETGSTSWHWQLNGGSDHHTGDSAVTVSTGTYGLTETNQPNFHFVGLNCVGGTLNGKNVTVSKNANVVCTFTNAHDTGNIKFVKTILGGGTASPNDWTFSISGDGTAKNGDTKTLKIGSYTVTESGPDGYVLSSASGACSVSNGVITLDVTTRGGTCTITNQKLGSIKVCKVIIDGSGNIVNGSEVLGSTFTVAWDKGLSDTVFTAGYTPDTKIFATSEGNDAICTTYNNLPIAAYHYSQESISNSNVWETAKYNDQYESSIDDIGDFYGYNTNSDSNGEIDLRNDAGINRTLVILNQYKFGKINVTKFNDLNGNGVMDAGENNLSDWTINLSGDTKVTNNAGSVIFDKLTPNTYTLSENITRGWTQTNITCTKNNEPPATCGDGVVGGSEQCDDGNRVDNDACSNTCQTVPQREIDCYDGIDNDEDGFIDGDDADCRATFKFVKPLNAQSDGDSYNHKLVTVNPGDVWNCTIGNRLITPTATISKSNDASGDLNPGSSVGYKIKVNISGNDVSNFKVTDLLSNGFKYRPGSYKVLVNGVNMTVGISEPQYHSPGVWNIGDLKAGDVVELSYLADISSDQQPGTYRDLAYAFGQSTYGDHENVLASATPIGYVDENFVGTEVPVIKSTQSGVPAGVEHQETSTGEVLGVSTELPSTGSNTLWLLIALLMSTLGLGLIKRSGKKILPIIIFVLFFIFSDNAEAIANLSLRVEQPKTPINTSDVNLNFVALDINNDAVTVRCYKKSPLDSSYTQFGSDIVLSAGGNANHCSLAPVLTTEGTYQFYLTATSSTTVTSSTISLDYKTSSPGAPVDYRKEHPNNCDYKIHFKTADDSGRTVKVELYRSDLTNFLADSGSVVSSVSVGSNEERDVTNSVPDCNKNYYYVIRAFDAAGNGSAVVGDSVTVSTSSSTTTTVSSGATTTTGAIPVTGVNLPSGTENLGTSETTTNNEGQVLGVENFTPNFLKKYWPYMLALALVIIAIIGYGLLKKKQQGR